MLRIPRVEEQVMDLRAIERLFNERSFKRMMESNIAHILCRTDKRTSFVLTSKTSEIYTDGSKIVVGLPKEYEGMTYGEIYSMVKACVGHESAHVKWSNFNAIKGYLQEVNRRKVGTSLGHSMFNIIEDGRIERLLCEELPGYIKHIQFLNSTLIKKDGALSDKEHVLANIIGVIHFLAVLGVYPTNYTDLLEEKERDLIESKIHPLVLKGVMTNSYKVVQDVCLEILDLLKDYIPTPQTMPQELIEFLEALAQETYQSSDGQDGEDRSDLDGLVNMIMQSIQEQRGSGDNSKNSNQDQNGDKNEQKDTENNSSSKNGNQSQEESSNEEQDGSESGGKDNTSSGTKSSSSKESDNGEDSAENEDGESSGSKAGNSESSDDLDENGDGTSSADETEADELSDKNSGGSGDEANEESDEGSDNKDNSSNNSNKNSTENDSDKQNQENSKDGQSSESGENKDGDNKNDSKSNSQNDSDNLDNKERCDLLPAHFKDSSLDNSDFDYEKEEKDFFENLKEEINQEAQRAFEKAEKEEQRASSNEANSFHEGIDLSEVNSNYTSNRQEPDFEFIYPSYPFRKPQQEFNLKIHGLRKVFEKILKNDETHYKGQKKGRLDTKRLWRVGLNDTHVFKKKNVTEKSDYSVEILIDASGSMWDRLKYKNALGTAICIEAALTGLEGVEVKTVAFNFTNGTRMVVLKDFNDKESKTPYAYETDITTGSNRDGFAIRVALNDLKKRNSKNKLLVIISDGMPNARPYESSEESIADVKDAVHKGRKDTSIVSILINDGPIHDSTRQVFQHMYEEKGSILVDVYNEPDALMKNIILYLKKMFKN